MSSFEVRRKTITPNAALFLERLASSSDPLRFRDFQSTDLNDKSIKEILERLSGAGYVTKHVSGTRPVYKITREGREVFEREGSQMLAEIRQGERLRVRLESTSGRLDLSGLDKFELLNHLARLHTEILSVDLYLMTVVAPTFGEYSKSKAIVNLLNLVHASLSNMEWHTMAISYNLGIRDADKVLKQGMHKAQAVMSEQLKRQIDDAISKPPDSLTVFLKQLRRGTDRVGEQFERMKRDFGTDKHLANAINALNDELQDIQGHVDEIGVLANNSGPEKGSK